MREDEVMFPARFWFGRYSTFKPFFTGSDEWGRHTIVLSIPFVAAVVIATKPCRCVDMIEFACVFPGCPFQAIVPGGKCVTHDEGLYDGTLDYLD